MQEDIETAAWVESPNWRASLGFDQRSTDKINDYDGAISSFNLASHGLNPDSFILDMNRSQGIEVLE